MVGTLVPEAQTRIMVSAPGRRGGGFGWLAAASQRKKKTGRVRLGRHGKSLRVGIEPKSTPHLSSLGKVVQC